jgi:hypothetical protein
MQGQGLIGLGMRMLQGGKDKTGFGDLYESLGVTRERSQDPVKLLAAAIAASKMGDDEITDKITNDRETVEDKITGGDSEFSFNDIFDSAKDYVDDNPLTTGINTATGLGLFGLIPKTTRGVANKALNFLLPIEAGIANVNEQVGNIEELENDPTVDPEFTEFYEDNVLSGGTGLAGGRYSKGITLGNTIKNLFGFEDGGRVGMQQGGIPMPALLGVSSGSTGTLPNYSMGYDPSAIPGPDYNYQAPQLTSLASPFINSSFDISSLLGGPDPFAVSYNPYVNATGTEDAYEQYGLNMSEDEIMDAFSDLDKYSLAAQEAKRKAAEEAAKKKKQGPEREGGGGGGNNTTNNTTNNTNSSGGYNQTGLSGSQQTTGGPGGANFGGYGHGLA